MRKRIECAVAAAHHDHAGTAAHITVRRVVTVDDINACGSVPDEDRQLVLCARRLVELRTFVEPFSTAVVGLTDTEHGWSQHNSVSA